MVLTWAFGPQSQIVPALLHLGAHARHDFLRETIRPLLDARDAFLENFRLLDDDLSAQRRLVERQHILQFGLRESQRIETRDLGEQLGPSRSVFGAQLLCHLGKVLAQPRIGLKEHALRLLDDARNDRIPHGRGALELDELLRQGDRRWFWLLRLHAARKPDHGEHEQSGASRAGKGNGSHSQRSCLGYGAQLRWTTRTPPDPAMTAACASPMKSPCSTTPGTAANRSASD